MPREAKHAGAQQIPSNRDMSKTWPGHGTLTGRRGRASRPNHRVSNGLLPAQAAGRLERLDEAMATWRGARGLEAKPSSNTTMRFKSEAEVSAECLRGEGNGKPMRSNVSQVSSPEYELLKRFHRVIGLYGAYRNYTIYGLNQ